MRERKPRLRTGALRIGRQRLLKVNARLLIRLDGAPLKTFHPAQPAFVHGELRNFPPPRGVQHGHLSIFSDEFDPNNNHRQQAGKAAFLAAFREGIARALTVAHALSLAALFLVTSCGRVDNYSKVDRSDELAANPLDPDRMSAGVQLDQIRELQKNVR